MDRIHKPEIRSWINQESIRVSDFIDKFKINGSSSVSYEVDLSSRSMDTELIACSEVDQQYALASAAEECDSSALDCEGEDLYIKNSSWHLGDIAPENDLETLKLRRQHLKRIRHDPSYKGAASRSTGHRNNNHAIDQPAPSLATTTASKDINGVDQVLSTIGAEEVMEPEAVLTVQIYRPIRAFASVAESRRIGSIIPDQELLILSSQYLSELKDAFACVSDIATPGDCSDNTQLSQMPTAGDLYKSSCFFINNRFYNDRRSSEHFDYSKVICDWAKEKDRGIGPFEESSMAETLIRDLEIRIGQPYLYMHQGDCEHLVVFSELRLFNQITDSCLIRDYPKYLATSKRLPVNCGMCKLNTSRWLTYDDPRMPEEPFFFCDNCFQTFCYGNDGEKFVEFRAYPFLDRTALL